MKKTVVVFMAGVLAATCGLSAALSARSAKAEKSVFLSNYKTSYKVLYAEDAVDTVLRAASEFEAIFYDGTGTDIELVSDDKFDDYDEDTKWISLGDTVLSRSKGITVDVNKVGSNGYHIQTKGDNAFIMGGGPWGTIWGVYDFLGEQIGYDFIYTDEELFDEEACRYSRLVDLDKGKDVRPSLEWRLAGDGEGCNNRDLRTRMRMQEVNDAYIATTVVPHWHNFFFWVDAATRAAHPNWVGENASGGKIYQLCLSRERSAIVDHCVEIAKQLVQTVEDIDNFTFNQEDNIDWCCCSSCQALKAKYGGANSVTTVLFLKEFAEKFGSWASVAYPDRKITIYSYAYWATFNAPDYAPELELPDNAGIIIAPIDANHKEDFFSQANQHQYAQIEKWKRISKNFAVCDYEENFQDYMTPYDSWNRMQGQLKYFHDIGGKIYYNMMAYGNLVNSDWSRLHMYLESHLEWNVNENFNDLCDNFFDGYYKDASPYMREWFEAERAWMTLNGHNGCLPEGLCKYLLELADKAYDSILRYKFSNPTLYTKLYDRITLETLSIRFLVIEHYLYMTGNGREYMQSFANDCAHFGVQQVKEVQTMSDYLKGKGL